MEGVLDTTTVTRQELVDYVVNKKVRAIQDQIEPLKTKRSELEKKLSEIQDLHKNEKREYSLKWIKTNYGKMIESMKKNIGSDDPIIVPCYAYDDKKHRGSRDMVDLLKGLFLFRDSEAAIVFINKNRPKTGLTTGGGFGTGYGPHHGGYFIPFDIGSFIRVDMSGIESPKSAKLKTNKEALSAEIDALHKTVQDLQNQISSIQKDKDLVKEAIIEEILGKTPDGKALLEKVNNLPIGQKLIG
jgi:polyhydroxyalkanoate synthesis regulator phasin